MLNWRVIFFVIGFLLGIEGIAMMLGIPFSIYYGDNDIWTLVASGIGISLLGLVIIYITKKSGFSDVKKRDGYLIVTIGWIAMSVFGALPFVIHGSIPSYTDAFFETMSGFTTTGASILNNIEELPHGILFWRSLTQWLGGMGFIVLSIAILPLLGIGGMQLFVAEVPGPTKDKIHPRVKETAKRLWGIYVLLTILETIFLMIGGMNLFEAVNHAFTSMATGGFSTRQDSLAAFSPYIQYVTVVFMFLAGANFTIHYFVLHGKFSVLKQNEEFKFYAKVTLSITAIVAFILLIHNTYGIEESFRMALFHTVSLITTTGYVAADYEYWVPFAQVLFFLLLFIGGCAGSTGGGIKIVRHLLLIRNSLLELKRLVHPRAVIPVRFNNIAVNPDIIYNVLAFFLFYIFLFAFGTLLLSLMEVDFTTSMGAVATSIGNVGPGLGEVGPVKNFANIPEMGKWLLTFFMLLGRLELFTVLIIFSQAFWKK